MQPSITDQERALFKVKRTHTTFGTVTQIALLIFIVLFLIAFCVDNFTSLTTPAHAATIHQNDYYCNQLAHATASKPMLVIGATTAQIKAVCGNLK